MNTPKIIISLLIYILPIGYWHFTSNQFFQTDIHIFIFFVVALLLVLANRKYKRIEQVNIELVPLLFIVYLLILIVLHNIFSINDSIVVIQIIIYALLMFYLTKHIDKQYFNIEDILCTILIMHSITGIIQFISNDRCGGLAIKGIFNNSGVFGNYIMSLLPFIISSTFNLYCCKPNKLPIKSIYKYRIIFYTLACILGLFIIGISLSRASWLGTIAGLSIITLYYIKKSKKKINWIYVFILIPLSIFIISYCFQIKKASIVSRLQIYHVNWIIFKKFPILGTGIGNFSSVFNEYQGYYFKTHNIEVSNQLLANNTFEAFNSLIQIAVECGTIGIIMFLSIFFIISNAVYRKIILGDNVIQLGASSALFAIFISSLFSNPFHQLPIAGMAFLYLSILPLPTKRVFIDLGRISLGIQIFLEVFAIIILIFEITRIEALHKWHTASELALKGEMNQAAIYYELARLRLNNDGRFLFNYGSELNVAGYYDKSVIILKQAKKYYSSSELHTFLGDSYQKLGYNNIAEKEYLHAISIVPCLFYPKYKLLSLYIQSGQVSKAKKQAKIIIEYPIKVQNRITDDIKLYSQNYANK
jgi:O-antigen polymerase